MIKIIPLTKEYLDEASELVLSVFPGENIAPRAFEASFDEKRFKEFVQSNNQVKSLEYFIAVDENDNVLGISGLYSMQEDFEDSYWLGWYCVGENNRGKGIGKALLDYCIDETKTRGKKYLKIRTSKDPREEKAQRIYEENGFYIYEDNGLYITEQKKEKDNGYEKVFRRKEIN